MRLEIQVDALEITASSYDEQDGFLPGFMISKATVFVQGHDLDVLEALEANQAVYSVVYRELEKEYERIDNQAVKDV